MTDNQEAAWFQKAQKTAQDLVLCGVVEVDKYIAAENKIELDIDSPGRRDQVAAAESNKIPDFLADLDGRTIGIFRCRQEFLPEGGRDVQRARLAVNAGFGELQNRGVDIGG